jgi:hypothetical protein
MNFYDHIKGMAPCKKGGSRASAQTPTLFDILRDLRAFYAINLSVNHPRHYTEADAC